MIHKNKSLDGIEIPYEMEVELCEWNDSNVAFIKNDIPIPSIYNISKTPFRYHNKIKAAKRLPFIIRNFL